MDTDVYTQVKASIKRTLNINLENYKDEQMKRRLDSWLVRAHIDNWKDYFNMLSADTKETERFRNYLTINVTEFFRDPSRWDLLQRDVLPYLIKNSAGNHELKLWSAGCSIGTEAYTMAILMNEATVDSGFDLIVCRNVVIYFTAESKEILYAKFCKALRPGSVLFVGGTEIISTPSAYGLQNFGISFYKKV